MSAETLNWCFSETRLKSTAWENPSMSCFYHTGKTEKIVLLLVETAAVVYRVVVTIRGKKIQCGFLKMSRLINI
jgi:hypothetical protein